MINELAIADIRNGRSSTRPLANVFVAAAGQGLRAWWSLSGTAGKWMAWAAAGTTPAGQPILQSRQHAVSGRDNGATSGASGARFQRDMVSQLDAAYNFARFLSRDADAAQDIVQEAFLRAYRGFDGFQGGDARAWIFAIVRNCYHDWLLARRRKARLEVENDDDTARQKGIDDVASEDDDPETALLRRTDAATVRDVLGKLPRPSREMLVLREIEGLSYRQIADIASVPIGTVMSRLARARAQFQAAWRRETEAREVRS